MSENSAPVSVIIPCYRCANTIERAVKSVQVQTVAPAQIVLIDDASRDETLDKLKAIAATLGSDKAQLIEMRENGGPAAARNAGWDIAAQPYIAFLDADDSWHPRKIEIQYGWMADHPEAAFSSHAWAPLREDGDPDDVSGTWQARRITARGVLRHNISSTPTVMLRRDLPFRFDPDMRFAEDYLLWMRIVLGGCPCYHLPVPLTFLPKAAYGAGGLSGHLWKMERGELRAYGKLHAEGLISRAVWLYLCGFSLTKYVRRVVIVAAGNG